MTLLLATRLICALSTLSSSSASTFVPGATTASDSAAITMIGDELRAYYRDLHDRNWTAIVTHFYPAKVTARFAVPDSDPAWSALAAPSAEPQGVPDAHGYCAPHAAIAVVGNWARVRARRCTGELDEAWFYVMSGRWKIIHLDSAQPVAM